MLKFLFYLFLFYMIYRFISGGLKMKVYHYHQTNKPHDNSVKEEGRITIDPKVSQQKKDKRDKLGEYVDFEEIN